MEIRLIQDNDYQAVLDLYRPFVLETAISFEYELPSIAEFSERIRSTWPGYPFLVCVDGEHVIGYAYAGPYKSRAAYQWSVESTIYVSQFYHGKGIARILYNTLFKLLTLQGYRNVFAGVAIPNPKSEGFHLSSGFVEIGTLMNIGYKLNQWQSLKWFQKHLGMHETEPVKPKQMTEMIKTNDFKTIVEEANQERSFR